MKKKYLHPQPSTVGLVGHWKLWDGLSGVATVFDYTLNGSAGTVTNALVAYPGFSFDGIDDAISCGSATAIDDIFVGGGTAACWLLSNGLGENNLGKAISKGAWYLGMVTNTTTMRFAQAFAGTDGAWNLSIATGVWQHVAIVYDNDLAANDPVFYVNGVSVTVTQIGANPDGDVDTSDAANSFIIGDNVGSTNCWDGKMGEVRLYDSTKTAAQMKSLFELTRWRYRI